MYPGWRAGWLHKLPAKALVAPVDKYNGNADDRRWIMTHN